jgi:hypothetical protein
MRGDDLTLALIELRQSSAREQSFRSGAWAARREQHAGSRRRWSARIRGTAPGVRVWWRTSWHTLSGQRAGDRPRR